MLGPLRELQLPCPHGPRAPARPAIGEPGVLETMAREAGLDPRQTGEVDVPYELPDQTTLERTLLVDTALLHATEHAGEGAVRKIIADAAAPFRRPDGSYRLENKFRYLIAGVGASSTERADA